MQTPTIGRIVHHTDALGTYAAIVTAVHNATAVALTVFPPNRAPYALTSAFYDEGGNIGSWCWPPLAREPLPEPEHKPEPKPEPKAKRETKTP
jgi:hypothetical protein